MHWVYWAWGSAGPYLQVDHVCLSPFRGVGGDSWPVSGVKSSVHTPRLPRFNQLGSFSDTLLVVLILDIVYDCHLGGFAVLKELLIVPVGTMGSF